MGAGGIAIRSDLHTANELRRLAKCERAARTARRMLAIANGMDGMTRGDAARSAGIERQSLRDAVVRYNAEGIGGLKDREKPGRRPKLDADEQEALKAAILAGPPIESGLSAWTLPELAPVGRGALFKAPRAARDVGGGAPARPLQTENTAPPSRTRRGGPKGLQRGGSAPGWIRLPIHIQTSASICGFRTRRVSGKRDGHVIAGG